MAGYHPIWGWDTPARANLPKVTVTPPKKPRARKLRDGRWWIHTGDARQPSALGWSLAEAWMYWERLCAIQGKRGAA